MLRLPFHLSLKMCKHIGNVKKNVFNEKLVYDVLILETYMCIHLSL